MTSETLSTTRSTARTSPGLATLALVGVTFVWGGGFLVVKDAVDRMPVASFLAVRFVIATLVMVVLRPRALASLSRAGWRHGVLLGVALSSGYLAQTFGLQHTPASVSGFITGMFVVFTPLIAGLFLRQQVTASAWAAVALATSGLALLSLRGFAVSGGAALTVVCAFAFAVHIVGLGQWSRRHDAYPLAIVQLGTVSVICLVWSLPTGVGMPPDAFSWWAVVASAVLATAVAFLLQTWAQTLMSPTRAAVVLTMEPVFAGIVGVAIGGDRLGIRGLIGAAFVVAAMYLVELGPRHAADATVERLE